MTIIVMTMLFIILLAIGVIVWLYMENLALRQLIKEIESIIMKGLESLKQLLWLPFVEMLSSGTDDDDDEKDDDEINETI